MIKVKYETLSNDKFTQALLKLAQAKLTLKAALAIDNMIEEVNKARASITESFKSEVMVKFADLNEDGTVKFGTDGDFNITEDKRDAYIAAMEAFGKTEMELPINKLPVMWVSNAEGLSAVDALALRIFIDMESPEKHLHLV